MCAPTTGTTTASRLHDRLRGTLIDSGDFYRDLGISLPDRVAGTRRLTASACAYERPRDAA